MSSQRIITIRICRRAALLLSKNSARSSRISRDRAMRSDVFYKFLTATTPKHCSSYMATERQLITRCYQIS